MHDRLVPLPDVAALVERAVGAFGVLELAGFRSVEGVADGEAAVVEVRVIARVGPEQLVARIVVGARREIPVVARHAVVLVVGGLVPFVLGRDDPGPVGLAHDGQQLGVARRAVKVVGPVLGGAQVLAAGRLAVVQPVGEAGRVAPANVVHRPVGPVWRDVVRVIIRRAAALDLAAAGVVPHLRVVQPVGVRRRHGVEKLGVLPGRDLELPDVVDVIDRSADAVWPEAASPAAGEFPGIAGVADGHGIDDHVRLYAGGPGAHRYREHDLDGLGSQAIIQRYFSLKSDVHNDEVHYFFADYTNFVEKIKNILSTETIPSELIISDLGFNESFKEVFPHFQEAKKLGCVISWFDHHIVDASIKKEIESLIYIYKNDPEKCAAEIVRDYFLKEDPISSEIAEFARDTDFRTNKYRLASDLQSIIGFNRGAQNDQNKHEIVRLLSQGDFHNPWFMDQLKALNKWLEEESAQTLDHAKVIPVESFGDIVVSWAKIGGGKITRILKQEYSNAKAFIGIDTRNEDIIIYSSFFNCRDFAREFGGGGHKERAGFKYPQIFEKIDVVNPLFLDDIVKTISKFS